jgi:asparagine synthase (glutamine-hydrolysing)
VTLGFSSAQHDETALARQTGCRLGIRLVEERDDLQPFDEQTFDDILDHYGQPFLDTSSIPTRLIARAGRGHFKVVLSGDGGDEILSGYLNHTRNALLARWGGGALGAATSRLLATLLPRRGCWEEWGRALELNGSVSKGLLLHAMDGVFTDQQLLELVDGTPWVVEAREHLKAAHEEARTLWRTTRDSNLAVSLHLLRTTLPQQILAKVDRMSMAESLEVRAPMLDSKLASYALSLPAHLKVNGRVGKYVLRNALRTTLTPDVLCGPKRGFCLPVRDWLGERFWEALHREVEAYARDDEAELNPVVMRQRVASDKVKSRRQDSYRALHRSVLLYSFLRWRRMYLKEGRPEGAVA